VRDGVEEAEKGVAEGLSVEGGQEEVASTVDWARRWRHRWRGGWRARREGETRPCSAKIFTNDFLRNYVSSF
jgi:hypothetical protein